MATQTTKTSKPAAKPAVAKPAAKPAKVTKVAKPAQPAPEAEVATETEAPKSEAALAREQFHSQIITVLGEANPKRVDSKRFARYAAMETGKTVGQAIADGSRPKDIKRAVESGYISLTDAE